LASDGVGAQTGGLVKKARGRGWASWRMRGYAGRWTGDGADARAGALVTTGVCVILGVGGHAVMGRIHHSCEGARARAWAAQSSLLSW